MRFGSLGKHSKPTAAVFVDFEHWCYSLSDLYGLKPQVVPFYEEISEQYDVKRILFFGDFTEPKMAACIEDIRLITSNIIDTQNPSTNIRKDYTDFIMLDFIYQDVDDFPRTDAYIIFSGDGHFSSAATYLKRKKKKKVIIYGVVEATSQKLKNIADEYNLIPIDGSELRTYYRMIMDDLDYVASQNKRTYATYKTTVQAVAAKNAVSEDKVSKALQDLLDMGVLHQEMVNLDFGRQIRVIKADWKYAAEKGFWDYKNARPMSKINI